MPDRRQYASAEQAGYAATGAQFDVEAAPTDLSGGGASFQDWLAPVGVNAPAQPPRG